MSVAGTAADDVWTVGARGSLLHFDGEDFREFDAGVTTDLWWVHAVDRATVLVGGTEGTLLQGNADEGLSPLETPGTATVYGIWGSDGDLWAVGGDANQSPGFVWRDQGEGFQDVTDELGSEDPLPPLFKVWGRAQDDVWIVGIGGIAIHFDGADYEITTGGTSENLFTVNGSPSGDPGFVAVGGLSSAVIVENDGEGWRSATLTEPLPQLFGVSMSSSGEGFSVGLEGSVVQRKDGAWSEVNTGLEIFLPFHAVWIDPDGGVWAAGGNILSPTLSAGMLLHGIDKG